MVGDTVPLNSPNQTPELVVLRLSGDANQEFVQRIYLDLLNRPADPAALDYLSAQLDNGDLSRSQVVQMIQASVEYDANMVRQMYPQFLRRPVDPTGLSSWTAFLQSGGTRLQLEAQILASSEFYNGVSDGNPDTFLSNLHQDLLQRPIDASGLNYFELGLLAGVSRYRIVEAVITSPEFDRAAVNSLYLKFLGRPADPSGLAAFDSQLAVGMSPDQVIAQIVTSDEYFTDL